MKPSFWHRIDQFARNLTPFALCFVLVLLNTIPFHLPGFARVVPLLPLIGVYFWVIYRPDLMTSLSIFIIGLLHDFMSGLPLGISALTLLLVQAVALAQRRFYSGKSFVIVWFGFSLVAGGTLIFEWGILSLFVGHVIEARSAIFQYFLTLALFPVVAWLFTRWQSAFLATEWDS